MVIIKLHIDENEIWHIDKLIAHAKYKIDNIP